MALKSVLSIDVDDSQFQRFASLYEKYQAQLGKQVGMWQKSGASTVAIANQFMKMTASLQAQNQLRREVDESGRKQLVTLTQGDRLWTSMSKTTKSVATNIKEATVSLMRWAGIVEVIGGVLGVGGLFGINRMAGDVAGMRQTAMGRGVSIGEQTAMKNFSQLGIDASFLDTVAGIKRDPSKQWTLGTLGVSNYGSTAETTVALLKAMRLRAQATPESNLGLLDQQTGMNVGSNVWHSLASMDEKEFNQHIADYQRDSKQEDIGPKTAEGWANFYRSLQRAGEQLQKTFVDNLGGIQRPLVNLSEALNKLLRTILQSKGFQDGLKELGVWVSDLADAIKTGDFQNSVREFIAGVYDMAKTIGLFIHPVDTVLGFAATGILGTKPKDAKDYKELLGKLDVKYNLPENTLENEWKKQGGKFGKNPFNLSEQFARDNGGFNTDDPAEEASYVGKMLARESIVKRGLPGAIQEFDDPNVHVTVLINQKNMQSPGTSTIKAVNQTAPAAAN